MTDHICTATVHPVKGNQIRLTNAIISQTFLGVNEQEDGLAFVLKIQFDEETVKNFLFDPVTDTADIGALLYALELKCWEDLAGKAVRVKMKRDTIVGIGHFLKDQWINYTSGIKENSDGGA